MQTMFYENVVHETSNRIGLNLHNLLRTRTRGSAIAEEPRDALRQLLLWPFLTELLTRSSANPEELCEHTVS